MARIPPLVVFLQKNPAAGGNGAAGFAPPLVHVGVLLVALVCYQTPQFARIQSEMGDSSDTPRPVYSKVLNRGIGVLDCAKE
jgi:hypothetical protein